MFKGVKTFQATLTRDRERLGERVTEWIRENQGIEIVDKEIRQSSDDSFHCLTVTIFYK